MQNNYEYQNIFINWYIINQSTWQKSNIPLFISLKMVMYDEKMIL